MSLTKFLTIFLIAMVPTYIYRWVFVAGAIADASTGGNSASALGSTATLLLALSYAVMIYVSYKRGLVNDRKFLVAFPVAGAVFDILLGFIPFIPTLFNILTIIFGVMKGKEEAK
jgi:sugar phosphate permease